MTASLALDGDKIRSMVVRADSGDPIDPNERAKLLDIFEDYECWGPFFRLLSSAIAEAPEKSASNFIRLAKIQNKYLEDAFSAAETCANMVAELKLGYLRFIEEFLPQIVEFEDYIAEATILSSISDFLPSIPDQIACTERLCMLYEKKIHNETRLVSTYEKLLKLDPKNVRALRYFKLSYSQNNEWERVVEILKKLLAAVRQPKELFRVAQELAAIYLYQLDMPNDAIQTIESYCSDSPLDTSTILFDAYQRTSDWHGCLQVLRQSLLSTDSENIRAILHHKIGLLLLQVGSTEEATDNFLKAAKFSPKMLDSIEGIINICLQNKDWPGLDHWLGILADQISDERLRVQVQQAQLRLRDGLSHDQSRT